MLGVFAGMPYLGFGNFVFGLWGWIFGFMAAWFLSQEYKYFLIAHGGMVGLLAGLIGAGIAMVLDISLCLAGISAYTLVPALAAPLKGFTRAMGFWIPERFRDAIVLSPWHELERIYREAQAAGVVAIPPGKIVAGHTLFMVPLLATTAILGGVIGWKLFAGQGRKKQPMPARRPGRDSGARPARAARTPENHARASVPETVGGQDKAAAPAQLQAGSGSQAEAPQSGGADAAGEKGQ
jgi:hypothetical protein